LRVTSRGLGDVYKRQKGSNTSTQRLRTYDRGGRVMGYEPPVNDPFFYDDSDFIKCNSCDDTFDHNLYNSKTCLKCEDKQVEQERKK
jgi:hypothetical protein